MRKVTYKLWDLPTRIFHWLLVALIILQWISGENELMTIHFYSGYTIFGLVLYRVLWGLFGSDTARFRSFIYSKSEIVEYIRHLFSRKPSQWVGHNPLGGLSVILLLATITSIVFLGLISIDDNYINTGPLSDLVSYKIGTDALSLHEDMFDILMVFIGLHLAAIIFYRIFKKENLVKAMFTGKSELPKDPIKSKVAQNLKQAPLFRAALFAFISAATVYFTVNIFPILVSQ